MHILVDQQELDVTLEEERSLAQVVTAINDWVFSNGLVITTLEVDGTELALDNLAAWGDRAVESVSEIRIETNQQWELVLSHLELVTQFLRGWSAALEKNDRDAIRTLVTQQDDLARHLQEHIELIFSDLPHSSLASVYTVTGDPDAMSDPPDGSGALYEQLNAVVALLDQRTNEIRHPAREAAAVAAVLAGLLPDVRDVSVLLQTGKDEQAMAHVVRFTELVEKLLRTLPHLARIDDGFRHHIEHEDNLSALTDNLNTNLRELVAAFDAQDSVMIGDLLEYEIVPRIEELISVIPFRQER